MLWKLYGVKIANICLIIRPMKNHFVNYLLMDMTINLDQIPKIIAVVDDHANQKKEVGRRE